ncbi:MAG TPA: translocation/assembly module TamB domain-containing protein [Vicinamibacterales bacterium]
MRHPRKLVHVLVIVFTILVATTAAAVAATQTVWFKDWLRGFIVREANQYLNGTLSIGRLGGNLFTGVEIEDVAVSMDGQPVASVKDIGVKYNLLQIVAHGVTVDHIRLNHPVIHLSHSGDTWSISRIVKKQQSEADRSGPGRPLQFDDIRITDGSITLEGDPVAQGVEVPRQIDHFDASLAFRYEPVRYSLEIHQIAFRGSEPEFDLDALSGGIAVQNDTVFVNKLALRTSESALAVDGKVDQYLTTPVLNLRASSEKVSLPEIGRIVPAVSSIALQPAFELSVSGPVDRLGLDANVRSSAGDAVAKLVADVEEPGQSVNGTMSLRHVDLAPLLNDPRQRSDITADLAVNVAGERFADQSSLHGTVSAKAPQISAAGYQVGPLDVKGRLAGRQVQVAGNVEAYGAHATADGRVTLPDLTAASGQAREVSYDVGGDASRVDLRKLPRNLGIPAADTDVNARYRVAGKVAFGGRTPSPADVTADLSFRSSRIGKARVVDGSTAGVDLRGRAISYRADATVQGLDLQDVGEEFMVPALADDRYRSSINGHVRAEGRGTTISEIELTANGTLDNTTILGGHVPQLAFDATLSDDLLKLNTDGRFEGFDPSVASGRASLKGTVGGDFSANATVARVSGGITPDNVEADAHVDLDASKINGLDIDYALLDGSYRDSTGDIRWLQIAGHDVNVHADGTLALNDTGSSNFTLHADSPNLQTIAKLFDQPVTGIAKVDATITGNKSELQASGTLVADGAKYGNNGALAASSDFTASVKQLDLAGARLTATTNGTFVTLAGQEINELTATTTYAHKNLDFDLSAREPKRSLSAAGALVLHPEHQEVHLKSLDFQSQGVRWQTEAGTEPAIQYGGGTVSVENFRLTNDGQRIEASGTFGQPEDALTVTLDNVDVATVDALLLREPQLAGRLNASAKISGTKENPRVDGKFAIDAGGFRRFKYQTLSGTAVYADGGADVDAWLEESPTSWLVAKGYVPVTNDARRRAYALRVDSSAIDIGLVQGFTTALTDVTGVLQANVEIQGEVGDPHPVGTVGIENAAFKVVSTGVAYSKLDGQLDLQQDKVHIAKLDVLDNHQQPLSITGDLAIHEQQLGGVSLQITSRDFKVVDNAMGNVRINSDLRIAGELTAPRIDGELGVSTGTINLDPILATVGNSAYSTEETSINSNDVGQVASNPFDALQMYVHVTAPNDLVLKSSGIRTPDSPISLGAVNVTLGSDLYISKSPWDQIRLLGTVNTVRGSYDFQGRRFAILRDGTVRFEGLDDFDAALDIKAERVIQAVTATVNVRGRLKKPELALSSTPPLEASDILALIVFNQPINQLGSGEQASLAARAQSVALGAAAGQLAGSIGNALHLDTFEVNLASDAGSQGDVTIGQQVGQNLYVKVQRGLGNDAETNFIFEYELTRWLRFRANVLQGAVVQAQPFQPMQGSGADLLFFFSY